MSELRNLILIIVLLLSIVIGSSHLTHGHEWGDDFASYIMQAKSFLSGDMQKFIEHNSITIHQSSSQIGPVAYPWGYALILSPIYGFRGMSPLALKLPGLLFYVAFLVCLYLLIKNHLTQTESLVIVSLFAFNPMLIDFLDQILSDIPFLFFSTLALFLMTNEKKRGSFDYVLLGGVISFAFFIRTTGILLLASFLTVELFTAWVKRQDGGEPGHILRGVFVVCSIFGFSWIAYALIFPGGSETYFAQLTGFKFSTAPASIRNYFQLFSLFFGTSMIWGYLYYALFIFFLIGVWIRRKEERILVVFFSLWMILLIIWPIWQGPRFIFPVLPIFIYFIFHGMKSVITKFPEKYHQPGQWVFYGFWLLIIVIFLFNSSFNAYTNLQNKRSINGPFDTYSMEVYNYIKEKTSPESVIIFFKPRAMRLMTDHDAIMSTECDRMFLGDYIVLSKKVGENQQIPPEEIDDCRLPLDKVFDNRRFIIYEILK